jgi:hypothetical protein
MLKSFSSWFRGFRFFTAQPARRLAAERRLWVRYPCEFETTFSPLRGSVAGRMEARIRDVSRGGTSLLTDEPCEPGSLLAVELPAANESAATEALAYVVRCSPQAEGGWENGCVFALELPDEELARFGALRQETAQSDQRSWVRFSCKAQATYQRARLKDQTPLPAKLIDISANGIGLQVAEAIEIGSLLNIQIVSLSGGTDLPMLVSVVRVSSKPDRQWLLGCNFLRELSNRELHPFVKSTQS